MCTLQMPVWYGGGTYVEDGLTGAGAVLTPVKVLPIAQVYVVARSGPMVLPMTACQPSLQVHSIVAG